MWPHNHPIASSAHTENTPVQRLESKPAETKAETKLESKPSLTSDANRIAQKALYEGHRPWVGLDGGIQFPEPLTFEIYPTTRNMRLGVSYSIKNYGSAPALRAASFAETFVEKGPLKRPEMPMRMACLNADGPKDSPGSTVIFPGQSIRASSYITTNFDPTMHTIGQIWITICTSYTDDTGKLRHTKTWAITVPPKGDQPIPVKPGDQLLYYPRFEAQVYYEETDP